MFRFLFISLLCMWHVACTEASVPPPEPPETQTLVTQLDAGVLSVDAPADSGWVFNPENDAGIKLDAGLSSEDTVDAGIVSVLRPDSGQSVEEEENNGSAVDTQDAGVMTISPVDSGTQTTTFYDDAGTPWSPDSGDDEDIIILTILTKPRLEMMRIRILTTMMLTTARKQVRTMLKASLHSLPHHFGH